MTWKLLCVAAILLSGCGSQMRQHVDQIEQTSTILAAPTHFPPLDFTEQERRIPSVAEVRRTIQRRELSGIVDRVLMDVKAGEGSQFAGFDGYEWAQNAQTHEEIGTPSFAIRFLPNASQRLRQYTDNPLFEAREVDFTLSQYPEVTKQWERRLRSEGLSIEIAQRDIRLLNSQRELNAVLQRKGWTIPRGLTIETLPNLVYPAVSDDVTQSIRFFPQLERRLGIVPVPSNIGPVQLIDGCLFTQFQRGNKVERSLIIMPMEAGLYRDEKGYISFRNRVTGERGARIGTQIERGYVQDGSASHVAARLRSKCGNYPVRVIYGFNSGYPKPFPALSQAYRSRHDLSESDTRNAIEKCRRQDDKKRIARLKNARSHTSADCVERDRYDREQREKYE